ncbi:MAG: transketolase [Lewinella sp.]|nr:transketolase [Lewinella sp.]
MKTSTAHSSASQLPSTDTLLHDYYICCLSRELSIIIRRDVLRGQAKFGVSDDGKEVFQVAMAKAFRAGDWRSDYYRGHTLLLALGLATPEDMLSQLYADTEHDPFSAGKQMNNHHATLTVDEQGNLIDLTAGVNLSSDISTTGGQMARGLGLAFASKVFRSADHLDQQGLSRQGAEVCFCNIGDASTSEGAFWEAVNAAGVLQCPLAITVVDDGYGISVPTEYQTTKGSISEALAGFRAEKGKDGLDIYTVKGWDYPSLYATYMQAIPRMRRTHRPAVFHVQELTQPQGHSTSGSHERYKNKERLAWEKEYDCNRQFRLWLLATGQAEEEELLALEKRAKEEIKAARKKAIDRFRQPIEACRRELLGIIDRISGPQALLTEYRQEADHLINPSRAELLRIARRLAFALREKPNDQLQTYIQREQQRLHDRYELHLLSQTPRAALRVPAEPARYSDDSPTVNGYQVINRFFELTFQQRPEVYAFGEDVGKIGDVNQGMAGLQAKFGEHRIFDTGIREWTIVGQAIGMAMRGLRPIAEIQYLDYLIHALSPLSDDVATVRWRTHGKQAAPLIIRTRGHRLEGIWHSGSPMSVLLGSLRGIHICVPRNLTQAAGMYNTLLQSDDPGLVIEPLNGYRIKERLPDNLATFTVPLGVPEVLQAGTDLTLVTYGSCVRIAQAACKVLAAAGISVELIDVQTLWPFDLEHRIGASLRKTNRLLVLDEDVPGGAAAYITQHILEDQAGYFQLDARPRTLTAKHHRPPYGDDGDYHAKPSAEDVVETVYEMVRE